MENSKYEAVRAKIVEACPELMELSFGCKVTLEGDWWMVYANTGDSVGICHGSERRFPCKNQIDEILGHPIRLSHVLRAIADEVDSTACMYPDGAFVEWDSSGYDYHILFRYDLTKDDLSLQSPETIDFLFNILCE